ncbi:DUF378 domain-containing protein [Massilia glaciei]|uniref:DUF378 domain-containing protein n=1 Tax=Massilia glaciei TaxID=1524097 RepID=A0A2U2HDY0_9BURK|nr:DUF378 domain-containing protein [Massilia glaciei]PWF41533.1 DUF378 domain-containing protein [Massilia glaciei]
MATINAPLNERRHMPERRSNVSTRHGSNMSALDWIAMVLMIVGGINWGLVGLYNIDLVATLLGTMTPAARAVYVLVGLAALYSLYLAVKLATKPRTA